MTALDINPLDTPNPDWGEVVDLTAARRGPSSARLGSSARLDPIGSLRAAAERHFAAENWPTAKHLLQQLVEALDTYEDRFELCRHYCKLGCIAEKLGDDSEAIDHFLISFEFDTTHLPTLLGMAAALVRTERWNNARRILQIITIQHRHDLSNAELAQAHAQLGLIYQNLDQIDRSVESYKKALELDRGNIPALRAWSEMAIAREDYDQAFEARELLFGLTGGDEVDELLQHASLAEKLGDQLRAIDVFIRARQLAPHDQRPLRGLVRLYDETSQIKRRIDALAALAGLATDQGQRRDLYTELARAWVEQDDMAQAIDCLDRALDADPTFMEAFEEIERFLFEARDWPNLAAAYRRMIKRTPKDQSKARSILWRSLGLVYERGLRNKNAAKVAYETVLKTDPFATDIAMRLADLYARKRETAPKAIAIYQRMLATSDDPVVPARKLFELYSGLDQLDRAYCALGALILLGAANEAEAQAYQLLKQRLPKAPGGVLDADMWKERLLHPDCRSSLADIVALLYRSAPSLFGEVQRQLGFKKKEKVDTKQNNLRFFDICTNLGAFLGVGEVDHYHRPGTDAPRLLPGAPPVMYAGASHDSFGAMKTCQLRWTIARELASARPEIAPAFALPPGELAAAIEAAISLVAPQGSGVDHGLDPKRVRAWKKELGRHLTPYTIESLKEPLAACLERNEMRALADYLEGAERTALRAALLVAQDCAVVPEGEPGQVRDLVLFALSEDHFALREKLSMTVA